MARWVVISTAAVAVVLSLAGPATTASVATHAAADVAGGRRVFVNHCAMCHGQDATGMMGMHPALRGAVKRLSLEGVDVAIRKGRATSPPMPAWEGRLSDQEIADVIDFIGSLPDGPRNFANDNGDGGGMGMMGGSMSNTGWALFAVSVLAALLIGGIAGFALRARVAGRNQARISRR